MRTPNRSIQRRPAHRAPHGAPLYSARIGAWVTEEMYQAFHRWGGSEGLRVMFERSLELERAQEKAK